MGGGGSAAQPLALLLLPRALSCAGAVGGGCLRVCACVCVNARVYAWLCEIEAPGYLGTERTCWGFLRPDVPQVTLDLADTHTYARTHAHTHAHTQSARHFLYGNGSCQLPDRQTLPYDWLTFSDVGVSQGETGAPLVARGQRKRRFPQT